MPVGQEFSCPSCGGSLNPQGSAAQITCGYCGKTVIVPEELRAPAEVLTPENKKLIKYAIWGFVIFIVVTTLVPLICSLCGVFGGLAGAFVPFFVK